MRTDIRKLLGRPVVVHTSNVMYRGVLRELGTDSILLRDARGEREIPWDRISRVREDRRADGR